MRLSEAVRVFLAAKTGIVAPSTCEWYEARLGRLVSYLGDVPIVAVTINDLRQWRAELVERDSRWSDHPMRREVAGGLSRATIHGYVRAVRTFFKWLVDEGCLARDPARRLERPPLPRGEKRDIARRDCLAIIEAARDNPRDYALLLFLADSGVRVGGVVNLCVPDLDLCRGRAVVREKGRGGERCCRTVFFGAETVAALGAYLADRELLEGAVFVTEQAGWPVRPLRREGVYRVIQRYAKRAGVSGRWNPHSWRHAFAHGMLDAGADVGAVAQLLGHSSITVTLEIYGQRSDEQLADIHALGSWLSKARDS